MKNASVEMIPVMIGNQVLISVPAGTKPENIHCAAGGSGKTPDFYRSTMGGGGSRPVFGTMGGSGRSYYGGGALYGGPIGGGGGKG